MTFRNLDGPMLPLKGSMQTDHNYRSGSNYEITIKTPVFVSEHLPEIYFRDIAIVEPENDFVAVEATTNGLDWILLEKHDASSNELWHAAYQNTQDGKNDMSVDRMVKLKPHFETGELLLVRFRLISNTTISSWGWSIDYINIQEEPTAVEERQMPASNVYPNPTQGIVTINYTLSKPATVNAEVIDIFGRKVRSFSYGLQKPGPNKLGIDLSGNAAGNYLLILRKGEYTEVVKVILRQ